MAIDLDAIKAREQAARDSGWRNDLMAGSQADVKWLIDECERLAGELSRVSQFLPRATWHVYKPNLYLEMRLVHPLFAYKNVGAIFSYGDKGFRAECFGTRSKMCKSLPVAKAWVQAKVTAKYGVVVTPESEDANA